MTNTKLLTVLEVAKIACDIESDGIDFYSAAARVCDTESNKATFEELSKQEQQHLNTFRNMYKNFDIESGGSEGSTEFLFDEAITAYLRVVSEGLVFPTGGKAEEWLAKNSELSGIIHFALHVEKNSILFYSELLDHNAFAASREMLEKIIVEEKRHVVMLNAMLPE
jgi:rubrerythrin